MRSRTPANGPWSAKRRFRLSSIGLCLTAISGLLIASCATPQTRYVTTYCITKAQLDTLEKAEPGKVGSQLTGNAQNDLKLIAGNDIALRTYADGLLVVLGGCTDPNTGAAAK